jgi:hypothetical protein
VIGFALAGAGADADAPLRIGVARVSVVVGVERSQAVGVIGIFRVVPQVKGREACYSRDLEYVFEVERVLHWVIRMLGYEPHFHALLVIRVETVPERPVPIIN